MDNRMTTSHVTPAFYTLSFFYIFKSIMWHLCVKFTLAYRSTYQWKAGRETNACIGKLHMCTITLVRKTTFQKCNIHVSSWFTFMFESSPMGVGVWIVGEFRSLNDCKINRDANQSIYRYVWRKFESSACNVRWKKSSIPIRKQQEGLKSSPPSSPTPPRWLGGNLYVNSGKRKAVVALIGKGARVPRNKSNPGVGSKAVVPWGSNSPARPQIDYVSCGLANQPSCLGRRSIHRWFYPRDPGGGQPLSANADARPESVKSRNYYL